MYFEDIQSINFPLHTILQKCVAMIKVDRTTTTTYTINDTRAVI